MNGCVTAGKLVVTAAKAITQSCTGQVKSTATCGTGVSLTSPGRACLSGSTTACSNVCIDAGTVTINRGASITGGGTIDISSCLTLTNNGSITTNSFITLNSNRGDIVGSGLAVANTGRFCAFRGTIGTPCTAFNSSIGVLSASAAELFLHNIGTVEGLCTESLTNNSVVSNVGSSSSSSSGGGSGSSSGSGDVTTSSGTSGTASSSSSSALLPVNPSVLTSPGGLFSTSISQSFPAITPISSDPLETQFKDVFPEAPLSDQPQPSLLPDNEKKNKRALFRRLFNIYSRHGRPQ
ncbi:MAG: hypothetical protein ACYCW6_22985 [Candidatus Xenobia bacterium]